MKKVLLLLCLVLIASCSGSRVVQKCKRTDVIYDYLVQRETSVVKIDSLNAERKRKITKYTKDL